MRAGAGLLAALVAISCTKTPDPARCRGALENVAQALAECAAATVPPETDRCRVSARLALARTEAELARDPPGRRIDLARLGDWLRLLARLIPKPSGEFSP